MPTPFGFGNVLTLALRPEWRCPDPRLVRSLTSTPAIASAASRPPYAAGMTSPAPHTRLSDYREHSDEYKAGSRELLLAQDLRQWLTIGFDRVVLVVGRTVTALTRLLDIVTLIETDHRVQVVFTTDPTNAAIFRRGVEAFLAR